MNRKFLISMLAVGILLLVSVGVSGQPVKAAGPTVVTIGFDDGYLDQYTARPILAAHGMQATFFVNSGYVGDATHMSWDQLSGLYVDGNEIAGHTVFHTNVKKLKGLKLLQAICDDRVNLFDHGFQPASFAYPFGSYNTASKQAVQTCGYNSGRGVSGGPETIPPLDPYATRVFASVKGSTSLATIEGYVTQTEAAGGGWVQLVFHHVCDNCDVYSITPANFSALLDWLQPRSADGTVVMTTTQVIGGTVKPPVPSAP